ncbi:MAG: biotin/lipoyl-binding protein [Phycisphaerales bacterium]|nr:biotin/lipoyl-binding protein [Phycisphaerales bacterium]
MTDTNNKTELTAKQRTQKLLGRVLSIVIMALAVISVAFVWWDLDAYPRTADAFVRANIVGIAPHVEGRVEQLNVVDNQWVNKGDLLFVVDPRPYALAVEEARATLALTNLEIEALNRQVESANAYLVEQRAKATYAIDHFERLAPLLEQRFVTPDEVQKSQTQAEAAQAAVVAAAAEVDRAQRLVGNQGQANVRRQAAQAALGTAELFLEYCYVTCPFDGYVTNLNIARGEYANIGQQLFSIIDDSVWYVLANFRETLLHDIRPGMRAEVFILSCPGQRYEGVVQGVGRAIYNPEQGSMEDLANVPPTLDWVRLAQRFPVRIIITDGAARKDCRFYSGATAVAIIRGGDVEPDDERYVIPERERANLP